MHSQCKAPLLTKGRDSEGNRSVSYSKDLSLYLRIYNPSFIVTNCRHFIVGPVGKDLFLAIQSVSLHLSLPQPVAICDSGALH